MLREKKFCGTEEDTLGLFKIETIEIQLTDICNFKCPSCRQNTHGVLDSGVIIDNLDNLEELRQVRLSGGEVLLFLKECVDIINYCRKRGVTTRIFTNGSLMDPKTLHALDDAGLTSIQIALNFPDAETFDAYYHMGTHTFSRIIDGISRAVDQTSMETVARTILFSETEKHIVTLCELSHQLGVRKHEIKNGIPDLRKNWSMDQTTWVSLQSIMQALILRKYQETDLYFTCFDDWLAQKVTSTVSTPLVASRASFYPCAKGTREITLLPDGNVVICSAGLPVVIGSIFYGCRLQQISEKHIQHAVNSRTVKDACSRFQALKNLVKN